MDPIACLNDADRLVRECGEREEAAVCLANYFFWRIRGGFEPPAGDSRFESILYRLGSVADTLSETLDHNAVR